MISTAGSVVTNATGAPYSIFFQKINRANIQSKKVHRRDKTAFTSIVNDANLEMVKLQYFNE